MGLAFASGPDRIRWTLVGSVAMDVGAVGGVGISCTGAAGLSGAAGVPTAAAAAPCSQSPGIDGVTPQMQALLDLMGGLSSAQILMALLLSAGKRKDDSDPFAVLLGMAMAGQLQQMTADLSRSLMNSGSMQSSCCGTTVGTQLNVLA